MQIYFLPYYMNIRYSLFNSNSLMIRLFWSPSKTMHFFICLWLINISSVRSIMSDEFFCMRVMIFSQQIQIVAFISSLPMVIQLTGLTLPVLCVCPKPWQGFPTWYFFYAQWVEMIERWLFGLLILVKLLAITV